MGEERESSFMQSAGQNRVPFFDMVVFNLAILENFYGVTSEGLRMLVVDPKDEWIKSRKTLTAAEVKNLSHRNGGYS